MVAAAFSLLLVGLFTGFPTALGVSFREYEYDYNSPEFVSQSLTRSP